MDRKLVPVHPHALIAAATARDEGLLGTYLDLRTGGLLRLVDPAVVGRSNDAVEALLDAEPDRYAKVPVYTREYRLMTEFVDTVDDDDLARRLDAALAGSRAFRSFDAALEGSPAERDRWRQYREDALYGWIAAWLRALGVAPASLTPLHDREGLPEPTREAPALLQVSLRGVPADTADELVRVLRTPSEAQARALFVRLAGELCELASEPFRARAWRDQTRIVRGAVDVRRDGATIVVSVRR